MHYNMFVDFYLFILGNTLCKHVYCKSSVYLSLFVLCMFYNNKT